MDVREKLVELMQNVRSHSSAWDTNKDVADYLIAHGVTVQELDGCQHCMGVSYTDNPFTVITQMGREVKTQFNFCPNCGRRLHQPPKGE